MKKLSIALVFEKKANFFAENWQKSQKSVIITSTPGQDQMFACKYGANNAYGAIKYLNVQLSHLPAI
jgi:hypothetical protein